MATPNSLTDASYRSVLEARECTREVSVESNTSNRASEESETK